MRVRWSEEADRDRTEIVGYIWADNPLAAQRMDALFDVAANRLADFPRLGREGAIPGTREFIPHPSYRLVYEIGDGEIIIHALVHTARQWPPVEGKDD
ncbi:type II toxin-antitoxin system RelE/ParE family toxin [Mesorhizobium sp. BAC0120]|uniref:type II toxin-antitoxin system RelE/ParE family toxin n=1 Tax=Mesorhizobium sp. BAC0120 TaxID=3090670 RepID=UPI00298D1463|nr:type II toxin-antitoxin system RelE/ParE family toxin [Mesorhizobium sp. BAC0120]MDW6026492.1 type II toxin-antitoxin system RelE/ParE family toxin [Mesorhizobium sp. BAC0120]